LLAGVPKSWRCQPEKSPLSKPPFATVAPPAPDGQSRAGSRRLASAAVAELGGLDFVFCTVNSEH
jgi:hypothetical protein